MTIGMEKPVTWVESSGCQSTSLILELSRDKIVLYSSHNLFEAREIGRYVLAVKDGKLAMFDRIENLRGSHRPRTRTGPGRKIVNLIYSMFSRLHDSGSCSYSDASSFQEDDSGRILPKKRARLGTILQEARRLALGVMPSNVDA